MRDVGANIHSDGFTLIELMIVVAIVGILSSIAIPSYEQYRRKAHDVEAKLILASAYTAEQSFRIENDSFSACLNRIGVPTYPAPGEQRHWTFGFGPWVEGSLHNCGWNAAHDQLCYAIRWPDPNSSTPNFIEPNWLCGYQQDAAGSSDLFSPATAGETAKVPIGKLQSLYTNLAQAQAALTISTFTIPAGICYDFDTANSNCLEQAAWSINEQKVLSHFAE